MARAPALHAGGQEFESLILHQFSNLSLVNQDFFLYLWGDFMDVIKDNLNKMIEMLNEIEKIDLYKDDIALIKKITNKINDILKCKDIATDEFLDELNKDLELLDDKYYTETFWLNGEFTELHDLTNLFIDVYSALKRRNKNKYVENLRIENRKKRANRLKSEK